MPQKHLNPEYSEIDQSPQQPEMKIKRVGTRQEVFDGQALKTSGGLIKEDLILNSKGIAVSKKKSALARTNFKISKD